MYYDDYRDSRNMSKIMIISKYAQALLLVSFMFSATGCAVLIPVAATTTAGGIALSDRSTGEIVDDTSIVTKIKTEFARSDYNNLLTKISINAYEGRVMLTGTLKSQSYVDEAVKISWSIHGVKEVINELVIAEISKNKALDLWISSQIKTKFLLEKNFDSLNYSYDVNDQVVYLIGVAKSQDEMDRSLNIASSVSSVSRVVNYVILKTDYRRSKEMK